MDKQTEKEVEVEVSVSLVGKERMEVDSQYDSLLSGYPVCCTLATEGEYFSNMMSENLV